MRSISRLTVLVGALGVMALPGCTDEPPLGPEARRALDPSPPGVVPLGANERAAIIASLADISDRLLPSLRGGGARAALDSSIAEVMNALDRGETGGLDSLIAAARRALAIAAESSEAGAEADISAMHLAIEGVAALALGAAQSPARAESTDEPNLSTTHQVR